MILLGLISNLILVSSQPSLPSALVWDLKPKSIQPQIDWGQLRSWQQNLILIQTPSSRSLEDLRHSFDLSKSDFLKQRFEDSKAKLDELEKEIFSKPQWTEELKILIAHLEGLRANIAFATKNPTEMKKAAQRLLRIAKEQRPEVEKRLLSLLPTEATETTTPSRMKIYRDFDGPWWQAGWIDADNRAEIIVRISWIPKPTHRKDLFLRSRPLSLRPKNFQIHFPDGQILALPPDSTYFETSKSLPSRTPTPSVWKSPWLWAGVSILVGGVGYFTYSQLKAGSPQRTN